MLYRVSPLTWSSARKPPPQVVGWIALDIQYMVTCHSMLIIGMNEHTVITSPGVERISTPVERKASAVEPSGSMVKLV